MKKIFTLCLFVMFLLPFGLQAQLNETFAGLTLTTSGTATIGGLPTGWVQINGDNLTPASGLSYMGTNAWISRKLAFTATYTDTVVQSISWYSNGTLSNDWLITPSFTVASANTYLSWEGYAPDGNYPDGYLVKVATNAGTTQGDFTATLATIDAENSTGFAMHAISLGAYAGQTVRVAFVNNSNDMYILWLDDFKTFELTTYDAEMVSLDVERFSPVSTNVTIKGTIKNNGLPITSLDITWSDGGAPHTATLSGLNIDPFSTYDFTHTIPFNQAAADEFTINVGIASVNGGATETSLTNNMASALISTVSNPAPRAVVIEEGTGTWCGYCPRGAVAMEATYEAHPDGSFIGIAVHNGDPMTVTAYDDGAALSGFPGCNVDRTIRDGSVTTALFETYYQDRIQKIAPVAPTMTYTWNEISRAITISASAEFRTKISSSTQLLVVMVQDSVHGNTTDWDQANYYSGGALGALEGAGHNWATESDPVVAANMWYNHVGVALLATGAYDGDPGSCPANIVDGTVATKQFVYTVPAGVNPELFSMVLMVIDANSGEILNAKKEHFVTPVNGFENVGAADINFHVFPNLTSDEIVTTEFDANGETASVVVYNYNGQVLFSQDLGKVSGKQTVTIDPVTFPAGQYFVAVNLNQATYVKHLTVTK